MQGKNLIRRTTFEDQQGGRSCLFYEGANKGGEARKRVARVRIVRVNLVEGFLLPLAWGSPAHRLLQFPRVLNDLYGTPCSDCGSIGN